MDSHFHEARTTQAAARLLARRDGQMSWLKLLTLLYLADRRALAAHGRPITHDRFELRDHGPVLRHTHDLIAAEGGTAAPSYWHRYVSVHAHGEVALRGACPRDALSRVQERILDDVFDEFGHMGRWELARFTRTLPEWRDPHGSSLLLAVRDVLRGAGMDEADVDAVEDALAGAYALNRLVR